ncbi:hypothetical protein ILUMI_08443 [Ignelater luminosus]|uniref:PiggyBac transposable element-derived protein domain-containing protein n=1 Tax=Ignelater luminosus TaxID=2038154 RepID=A0A8K0GDE2_IGNLU|nr:hypothetical protein ILUMI_08443 [Ignelater luminosus]
MTSSYYLRGVSRADVTLKTSPVNIAVKDLGEESDIDKIDEVEQNKGDSSTEQNSEDLSFDEDDSHDGDGIGKSGLVMSIKRFKILIGCPRFDDRTTQSEQKALDHLASICKVFEKFVRKCQSSYVPGENVTIDKILPGFRGNAPFDSMYHRNLQIWHKAVRPCIYMEENSQKVHFVLYEDEYCPSDQPSDTNEGGSDYEGMSLFPQKN